MPDASGIQPNISLGVRTPEPASGNPLGMLSSFADVQNKMNQNQLFQLEYASRQRIGQILSQSPDMETGIQSILQDPVAAIGAAPIVASIRQGQLTLQEIAGKKTEQNTTALKSFLAQSAAAANDPSLLDGIAARSIAGTDPLIRKTSEPLIRSAEAALLSNLPTDPAARLAAYKAKHLAMLAANGIGNEQVQMLYGKPETRDQGGGIASGMVSPLTGGFAQAGPTMPKTLAPQVITAEPASAGGAKVMYGTGGQLGTGVQELGEPPASGPSAAPLNANALGVGRGPATSSATDLKGLTPAQHGASEAAGESVKNIISDMNERSSTMPAQMHSLDVMHDAIQQFQAGGGANIRQKAGMFLQALHNAGVGGVTDKMVQDAANGSLPAGQTFDALIQSFVTRQLTQDAQGQGKTMRPEVDKAIESVGKTTDPAAILQILDNARFKANLYYDQSQKWLDFKQLLKKDDPSVAGMEQSDFYGWYNRGLKAQGGLNTGPLSPEGVRGVPQPGQEGLHGVWNPKTKKIEPVQ